MYLQPGLCSLATFLSVNEVLCSCDMRDEVRMDGNGDESSQPPVWLALG